MWFMAFWCTHFGWKKFKEWAAILLRSPSHYADKYVEFTKRRQFNGIEIGLKMRAKLYSSVE